MRIGWLRQVRYLPICFLLFCFPPSTGAADLAAGDPLRGQSLFAGATPLAQGGAPCLACHGIAGRGMGMAGSASFGPDLTTIFDDYGAEGIAAMLDDLAFPSMEPIYATRPLTVEEQADMGAYLAKTAGEAQLPAGNRMAGHVAIGLAVITALLVMFGRGRLHGVRRPLVLGLGTGQGERR
ncbi:c-type cytochrome [Desulfoprunum benzoelyticum]|uniref:Mono/diheme cytochrome c family protein n=1 Tax=Desulfoprunum benzoelyticum TaxID=1506996 RepID=A0A840UV37_9BACT|nr:c-type cytochrome [Desulfoprunum benzoelyticum]MBB5349652.1 mono/diheme cytochrome c family protein [Desulfoprunum benzoelyticum]MBM9531719.1 c-type cytochrome [Desulfoprunum benzoelyticum]